MDADVRCGEEREVIRRLSPNSIRAVARRPLKRGQMMRRLVLKSLFKTLPGSEILHLNQLLPLTSQNCSLALIPNLSKPLSRREMSSRSRLCDPSR